MTKKELNSYMGNRVLRTRRGVQQDKAGKRKHCPCLLTPQRHGAKLRHPYPQTSGIQVSDSNYTSQAVRAAAKVHTLCHHLYDCSRVIRKAGGIQPTRQRCADLLPLCCPWGSHKTSTLDSTIKAVAVWGGAWRYFKTHISEIFRSLTQQLGHKVGQIIQ